MPRLLLLCRHPYHLSPEEAAAWLEQELARVVRADELEGARLTRLAQASFDLASDWGWLIELRLPGAASRPVGTRSASVGLVADLRLLGMAPTVAVADEREATELRRP